MFEKITASEQVMHVGEGHRCGANDAKKKVTACELVMHVGESHRFRAPLTHTDGHLLGAC